MIDFLTAITIYNQAKCIEDIIFSSSHIEIFLSSLKIKKKHSNFHLPFPREQSTLNTNWKDVSMSQQTRSDTESGQDNLVGTRHMHMDPPHLIQANNNLDSLLITLNIEHIIQIK